MLEIISILFSTHFYSSNNPSVERYIEYQYEYDHSRIERESNCRSSAADRAAATSSAVSREVI